MAAHAASHCECRYDEYFFNNIGEANKLYRRDASGQWSSANLGPALEPQGFGTGGAVADWDGDGVLELMVSHGESGAQPISLFRAAGAAGNGWIRIRPLTRAGAPARGANVLLVANGRRRLKSIDAGSGYLCQMEPVAHYGLGRGGAATSVEVIWPDGTRRTLTSPQINTEHSVTFPVGVSSPLPVSPMTPSQRTDRCAGFLSTSELADTQALIDSTPVVIFALRQPMRCTLAATDALDARGACYTVRRFDDANYVFGNDGTISAPMWRCARYFHNAKTAPVSCPYM